MKNIEGLPRFKDIHKNEKILVCGLGRSLKNINKYQDFITIGVNDIGRLFSPHYLVVLNPIGSFTKDRRSYIINSRAKYVFSNIDLQLTSSRLVKVILKNYGGTDLDDFDTLNYTQHSPYVAVCLAVLMGAAKVGIIGVDFTEHHFYKDTGVHCLSKDIKIINRQYAKLNEACRAKGIELVNLSEESKVTVLDKVSMDSFIYR